MHLRSSLAFAALLAALFTTFASADTVLRPSSGAVGHQVLHQRAPAPNGAVPMYLISLDGFPNAVGPLSMTKIIAILQQLNANHTSIETFEIINNADFNPVQLSKLLCAVRRHSPGEHCPNH